MRNVYIVVNSRNKEEEGIDVLVVDFVLEVFWDVFLRVDGIG